MVADTAHPSSAIEGLRPLSLTRDLGQVLELIQVAFGENLDAESRHALQSMRLPTLLAPFVALLDSFNPPGEGFMPGFVWTHGEQIIGTASARRIYPFRRGWLISNVAVHPNWQGRGIGRALMQAAVDLAKRHNGAWIALQVREDNQAAHALYKSLGFQNVERVARRRHAPVAPSDKLRAGSLPDAVQAGLRPAGWTEGNALYRLARTMMPHDVLWADLLRRSLYQTGLWSQFIDRLHRRRRQWWLQNKPGHTPEAAVGIEIESRNPWHRLRLLISPQAQSQALASSLLRFALHQLAHAAPLPVEIEHLVSDSATQSALTEADFEPLYTLIHMRLGLE